MPAVSQADGEPPHTGHAPAAGVLTAERVYLLQSREFLHLMREDVLSLKALGGDPISEEYLKAGLYHRAEALKDLPGTPLFFGRLDYHADAPSGPDGQVRPGGKTGPAGGSTLTRAARACRAARPSTSAGVTCTTPAVIPWSSIGGPRCPGPSTAPAGPSRWASRCAGGSASPAGS
jgi:hypothetical protein